MEKRKKRKKKNKLWIQQASFHSPQGAEAYVQQAKALSLFETGGDGIGCEKTLTLVTCSKAPEKCRM